MVKEVLTNKELENAVKLLHQATEKYLHATLELAKLHGMKKIQEVKPHILQLAKTADKLHTRYVRK